MAFINEMPQLPFEDLADTASCFKAVTSFCCWPTWSCSCASFSWSTLICWWLSSSWASSRWISSSCSLICSSRMCLLPASCSSNTNVEGYETLIECHCKEKVVNLIQKYKCIFFYKLKFILDVFWVAYRLEVSIDSVASGKLKWAFFVRILSGSW